MGEQAYTLIQFLVLPNFNMLAMAAALEPLRVANRLRGDQLYRWQTISKDGNPILTSSGLSISADFSIDNCPPADMLFVCASFGVRHFEDAKVQSFLRRCARNGMTLGAIGAGSFVLAHSGLLDGYRCTVHWEGLPAFREWFPNVAVTHGVYEIDRNRITCGGGVGALDMILRTIELKHGKALAVAISSQLLHERVHFSTEQQRIAYYQFLDRASPHLTKAVAFMEAHIENPVSIPDVAEEVGLAQRHLERLFKAHCGVSPREFYMSLRLDAARELLVGSKLSILEIAIATGFSYQAHFSYRYSKRFGITPTEEKRLGLTSDTRSMFNTTPSPQRAVAPAENIRRQP